MLLKKFHKVRARAKVEPSLLFSYLLAKIIQKTFTMKRDSPNPNHLKINSGKQSCATTKSNTLGLGSSLPQCIPKGKKLVQHY